MEKSTDHRSSNLTGLENADWNGRGTRILYWLSKDPKAVLQRKVYWGRVPCATQKVWKATRQCVPRFRDSLSWLGHQALRSHLYTGYSWEMHGVFKWTKVHQARVQQLWIMQTVVCRAINYDNGYGVLPDMGNSAESLPVGCLMVSNGERLAEESPNPPISYLRATGSQGGTVCFSNILSPISQKR